jgi:hypothetical protein
MIEREADQSRGERESPRAMTPEVVAARIVLRVAELRLLAAWTSVLAGRVRPPETQGSRCVPRWRGPTFWPLASRCAAISSSPRKRT